jgi:hypothetical protein
MGSQSVAACGHVSCTPHCGSHSAGSRHADVFSLLSIIGNLAQSYEDSAE